MNCGTSASGAAKTGRARPEPRAAAARPPRAARKRRRVIDAVDSTSECCENAVKKRVVRLVDRPAGGIGLEPRERPRRALGKRDGRLEAAGEPLDLRVVEDERERLVAEQLLA